MTKYFKVKVSEINQFGNSETMIGKVKFGDLIKIVRFSNREENPNNPLSDEQEFKSFSEKNFFQREPDPRRIAEISKFIEKEEEKEEGDKIAIFPTPIIISLNRDFEIEEEISEELDNSDFFWEKMNSSFMYKDELIIPRNKNLALVVDGQHRLRGIEHYLNVSGNEKIKDLVLPVIFLIGLDLSRLGEVFANINFKQRSVNKSFYYDIFGTLPSSTEEAKLCHRIVLALNNDSDSPLYKKINLLGKGSGFVSQAQIVDLIIKYFRSKLWVEYQRDFETGNDSYSNIVNFLKIYFQTIKEKWDSSYPKPGDTRRTYNYILFKSTGMGALIRLIKYIFPRIDSTNSKIMKLKLDKMISKISNKEAEALFDKNGNFGRSGSYGLQVALAKKLRKLIFNINEDLPW